MDNINGVQDNLNPEEEETSKNDEGEESIVEQEDESTEEETVDELKERLAKAEEVAENQKIRAEKAENASKKAKPAVKQIQKDETTLSVKDSARLQEAKVPVDDWDNVVEYAKFKGIEVKDALSSSVVKSILAEKAEERTSAAATSTGKGKRGAAKVSGENILEKASSTGKLPETDAEMDAMLEARYSA